MRFSIPGFRFAILLLLLTVHCSLFTSSCASRAAGKSASAVYQEAMGQGVREGIAPTREQFRIERPLGSEMPYIPLMVPAESRLVWVAPHRIGKDIFVHGHWISIKVRDSDWNPEIEAVPGGSEMESQIVPLPFHPESKPQGGP